MKRRIVFALISVLICVGAAVWLVPYTPMPDTAEIVDVLVLHVHAGDTAEDITGQVDTNAVCELLPQIRARRLPSYHRGISEDCYQIQHCSDRLANASANRLLVTTTSFP